LKASWDEAYKFVVHDFISTSFLKDSDELALLNAQTQHDLYSLWKLILALDPYEKIFLRSLFDLPSEARLSIALDSTPEDLTKAFHFPHNVIKLIARYLLSATPPYHPSYMLGRTSLLQACKQWRAWISEDVEAWRGIKLYLGNIALHDIENTKNMLRTSLQSVTKLTLATKSRDGLWWEDFFWLCSETSYFPQLHSLGLEAQYVTMKDCKLGLSVMLARKTGIKSTPKSSCAITILCLLLFFEPLLISSVLLEVLLLRSLVKRHF